MTHSRKDLTREQIERQIRNVKLDNSFPKRWKDVELDYLNSLLERAND